MPYRITRAHRIFRTHHTPGAPSQPVPRKSRAGLFGTFTTETPAPAEEADEHSDSNVQECTPNDQRCDLGLVITAPVPIEARGSRAISWPPVGVLLSHPSPVQLIKESESGCLSLLTATHRPDERAVAYEPG